MNGKSTMIRSVVTVLVGTVVFAAVNRAEARQFVDDEAEFSITVPYTYRAFTKNLPQGERFWEWESVTTNKGGDRTAGEQRAILRVARTTEKDPLKLLVAYERGGMKDRMPAHKVIAAPKLETSRSGAPRAVAAYEGLRPIDGALQFRFAFRVSVEIVRGRGYFKIVEVRAAGVPDDVFQKRVAEVEQILDSVVVR